MNFTNTIAESYVASGVLNDPEAVIPELKAEGINAKYFHHDAPKLIWRLATKFLDAGRIHEIEQLEWTDEIQGLPNGRDLEQSINSIRCEWCGHEIMKGHIKTLKNMYAIRLAHSKLSDALQLVNEGEEPEVISQASRELSEGIMAVLENQSGWKTAKQSAEEFSELLIAIHRDKATAGTPSGITLIDDVTGGLSPNELWVIGAQTSGGKTVLMLQIMSNFVALGKKVLLFSLETEANMIHARLASNTQNINMGRILGKSSEPLIKSDLQRLKSYINDVKEAGNLTICDEDSISIESIITKSQQVSDLGDGLDLIVVDYIQLVSLMNSANKSRHEQVAEVTRTLKQLAKRYQCPVITATQLNDDGRARESRAIAHDADVFLVIGDDSQYVYVNKNRNGERDKTLELTLNGANQRFQ